MAENAKMIDIYTPGSDHPRLADGPGGFDRQWFMGRWTVLWSTLPMWNDKRDVVIEYTPLNGSIDQFQSIVSHHKRTASAGSKPSTIKGTETLAPGTNGATFDWKGAGMLFFVHSHWEVLGYGRDETSGLDWAVTFFSKTLFTPAGMDIYVRSSTAAPLNDSSRQALIDDIVAAIKQNGDEGVRKLAEGGFSVPASM